MSSYKKRVYSRRANRDKYSVEQRAFVSNVVSGTTFDQVIVPADDIQGMRKVKHLTVSMARGDGILYWALVYVPSGTTPNQITVGTSSMYEPNQFVLSCGVFDFQAGPVRIHTPLSRNLNSGDSIHLLLYQAGGATLAMTGVVRYAITLQ